MFSGHNMEINILNVNSTIPHSDWNLIKLEISKLYNNNNNKVTATINKNGEITSTTNLNNTVVVNFKDYFISTNDVENVYFINYLKENKCLFYNHQYIIENDEVKENVNFFNNVKDIIKKTKGIDILAK